MKGSAFRLLDGVYAADPAGLQSVPPQQVVCLPQSRAPPHPQWCASDTDAIYYNSEHPDIFIRQGASGNGENFQVKINLITGEEQYTGMPFRITLPGIGPLYIEVGRGYWDGEEFKFTGLVLFPEEGTGSALCDALALQQDFDSELIIESPVAIAETYPGSKGVAGGSTAPFDINGLEIVPANPLNADTPLVNDLKGRIALIASDGWAVSSSTKANNAYNAGAVGVVIFNSSSNSIINIFGSDFIPTISVGKDIGEAVIAGQPVVGGIRSLP